MTTQNQENHVEHKSHNLHTNRILRIIMILVAAITAGSALNITISPIITTGGSVNVKETKETIPAVTGNTNLGGTSQTISTQSYDINDTIPQQQPISHLCGHITLKRSPCKHWVKGPGYCWQHRN